MQTLFCYQNMVRYIYSELTQIIGDVIADPTLPRTEDHPCPKCQNKESVFFQSHSNKAEVNIKCQWGPS
jgi:DNA-directed RNA polymerase II subunit RPB9